MRLAIDRSRDVGEAFRVFHPPDLVTRRRIERARAKGADADRLVLPADLDDERRRVRL